MVKADDYGNCVCRSSMLLVCDIKYLLVILLVICIMSGATGYLCYLRGNRLRIADNIHHLKAAELRSQLGITIKQRVILSNERVPLWRNPKSFTVIRAENFDAAVRLDSFREDIDIKQVDSFCIALRGSACYNNICEWIMRICQCLLNPADQEPRPTPVQTARSSNTESWTYAFSVKNRPWHKTDSFSDWLQYSTQVERLAYFRNKVCRLQILRENNNALFIQLKSILRVFMVDVGKLCVNRYLTLSSESEKMGRQLCQFNSLDNLHNLLRQMQIPEPDIAIFAELSDDIRSSISPSAQEILSSSSPALNIFAGVHVERDIGLATSRSQHDAYTTENVRRDLDCKGHSDLTLCNDNESDAKPEDHENGPNGSIQSQDYNSIPFRAHGFQFHAVADRQDHVKVGAIRALEVDKQEALLQSHGVGVATTIKRNGSSCLSRISVDLDEEVFLAQLALRAKLLNDEFQEAVIRIVEDQCSAITVKNRQHSFTADSSTIHDSRITSMLCNFSDCVEKVEIHSAVPKSVARMREKLHKYAHPHPRSIWPLCANILDPVRASVVCRGASQILQVLSWFTGTKARSRLPVCRMKNKFSFPQDLVPDGYRDLQICVLFTGSSGLSIIGEIQIHDAELHALKLKVSTLYK